MDWALDNLALIGELAVDHIRQSLIGIALGFLISVPIGWVAWRYRKARGVLIAATGLMYTIPSLALLLILPAVLGYRVTSEWNLIVALTLYSVALMVRAVADGLDSVEPDARQAAVAMGYDGRHRFWAVDLPLAGPVILAGLRVTAVSTISLATVGILVGVTNLGYLFTNGLQRRIVDEVVVGIIAVAVIALVVDVLLVLAGRVLMPWTRGARKAKPVPVASSGAAARGGGR